LIKKQTTQSAASIQKTTDSSATQKNDSILIANADATWKKLKTKYDRIQNIGKRKKTYEKLYSILMSFRN
jgi:hypothetical protein